jgi:hypothetical protein
VSARRRHQRPSVRRKPGLGASPAMPAPARRTAPSCRSWPWWTRCAETLRPYHGVPFAGGPPR